MNEEWRDVKGFEGLYQISNMGNLKHYTKRFGWRITKETNKNGWYFTHVLKDSKGFSHTYRLHRLVAQTFIGGIPKGYHVHHKDGNKQNNRVDNLEIIHPAKHVAETYKQNKRLFEGMNRYNRYVRPKRVIQYTLAGDFIAEYANATLASNYTGVCQRNILQVASGEQGRKQAGGFVWKFAEEKGVVT
jgi:NUMOD4 motif./HNH endonuclease.